MEEKKIPYYELQAKAQSAKVKGKSEEATFLKYSPPECSSQELTKPGANPKPKRAFDQSHL